MPTAPTAGTALPAPPMTPAGGGAGRRVLHVSPHPDDELLGAGATLALLRDQGWQVLNLAVSLGRRQDHDRRRAELLEAGRRLGIDIEICQPSLDISRGDDLDRAETVLTERLVEVIGRGPVDVVLGPHAEDVHPGHEVVGRAITRALEHTSRPVPWWAWGLWADLRTPNLFVPFGATVLRQVAFALEAYVGECARNGYQDLWPARSTANAVLGSERVFGFGAERASPLPYAELFLERHCREGVWSASPSRMCDLDDPLGDSG
ncbi:MAG TPA: PIG-L family deacetylase [Acidimicrobiales bacterium]|nr:PIG-L family deacetylase [Acidimicrobiales bacterium]